MPVGPGKTKTLALLACTCLAGASLFAHTARANPQGANIKHGDITINRNANKLTIKQGSKRAVINWQKFSIDKGEITQFLQNSKSSAVLNRVVSNLPSHIAGELTANGKIYLVNPNGIVFGEGARVNANSLIASTLNISNSDFLDGGDMHFQGTSRAAIVNLGEIHADQGDVFMIASRIRNEGTISAPQGTAGLGAGTEVYISTQADKGKRIVIEANSLKDELEDSEAIDNEGIIKAARAELATRGDSIYDRAINNTGAINATGVTSGPDGTVRLTSADGAVRNDGRLRASRAGGDGGRIVVSGTTVTMTDDAEVSADAAPTPPSKPASGGTIRIGGNKAGKGAIKTADTTQMAEGAEISADAAQNGDGGDIVVWSDKATDIAGTITARGGTEGGDGGFVETSAKRDLRVRDSATVTTAAPAGDGGQWLLDPHNVILANASGTDASGGGTIDASSDSERVDITTIEEALNDGNNVTITTGDTGNQPGDITVQDNIEKDSSGSGGDAAFTLRAARTIDIDDANIISSSDALDITLNADRDGNGSGAIDLDGTLQSNGGDIVLGGGSDPTSNPAQGVAGGLNQGVRLRAGSQIDAGASSEGGDITIRGKGADNAGGDKNRGIMGDNFDVRTNNAGTITLHGEGGVGTQNNTGIRLQDSGSELVVENGRMTLTGIGGGDPDNNSTSLNRGLFVKNLAKVEATGNGTIEMDGTAGLGTNKVDLKVTNDSITTDNGAIRLRAANEIKGDSELLAGTSGTIEITAKTYNLSPDDVNADKVTVQPNATGRAIGITEDGGTLDTINSTTALTLTGGELDTLENGAQSRLVIGDSANGNGMVEIDGWHYGTSSGTAIDVYGGDITTNDLQNEAENTLRLDARSGDIGMTENDLALVSGSQLSAPQGDIDIAPSNNSAQISIGNNANSADPANKLVINSDFNAGGAVTIGTKNNRMRLLDADFSDDTGPINLFGGALTIGEDNTDDQGLTLGNNTVRITAGVNAVVHDDTAITHDKAGTGKLVISAHRDVVIGDRDGSGNAADINAANGELDVILNADSEGNQRGAINLDGTITSKGGDVVLGGGSGNNPGLDTDGDTTLGNGGSGVDNTPAYGRSGQQKEGIKLHTGSKIDAKGGDIVMTGTGASNSGVNGNRGILGNDVDLLTTNQGNIRLSGTGGDGNDNNDGIRITSGGSLIEVGNGVIDLEGTGAGNMSSNGGLHLIRVDVKATGNGTINLDGTAGAGTTPSAVRLFDNQVTTNNGEINITSKGELNDDPNIDAGNDGTITITTQNYNLSPSALNADTITIKPDSNGTDIGLASGNGQFELDSSELDTLEDNARSRLIIGDKTSGTGDVDIDNWNFSDNNTSNNIAIEVHGGEIDADDMTNSNGNTLTMNAREGNVEITDDTLLLPSGSHFAASNNVIIQPQSDGGSINIGQKPGTGTLALKTGRNTFDVGNKAIIGDQTSERGRRVRIWGADFTGSNGEIEIFGEDITIGKDNGDKGGIKLGQSPVRVYARNHSLALRRSTEITHKASNTSELKLQADNHVTIGNDVTEPRAVFDSINGGSLDLTFNADRDGSGKGGVLIRKTNIATKGGDLTIGGGNDPANTPAHGETNPSRHDGVKIVKTNLTMGSGDTTIHGRGFDQFSGDNDNHNGILIDNSTYSATSGQLIMDGTGGDGIRDNDGVQLKSFDVSGTGGDIIINATAGGKDSTDSAVRDNHGIFWGGSTINMTGDAELKMTASADTKNKRNSSAVDLKENTITLEDGKLDIHAQDVRAPSGRDVHGILLRGTTVQAEGNADVEMFADVSGNGIGEGIDVSPTSNSQASLITTHNGDITLESEGSAEYGVRLLSDQDSLDSPLSDDTPRIASTGSGAITLQSQGAREDDLKFRRKSTSNKDVRINAGPSGTVDLIGDTMTFDDVQTIAANDDITAQPQNPGTAIGLGGGAGTLQFNQAEIEDFDAGGNNLVIGDQASGTGDVTISGFDTNDNLDIFGGDFDLNGDVVLNDGADAAFVAGGNFDNSANAAITTNSGRFLVYANSPSNVTKGGLGSDSTNLYNRSFASDPPSSLPAGFGGNNFVYNTQPELTISADDKSRIFGAPDPELTFSVDGLRKPDGDTRAQALEGAPAFDTPPPITRPGARTIAIRPGSLTSPQGYALSFVNGTMRVINTPGRDAEPRDARNVSPTEIATATQTRQRQQQGQTRLETARDRLPPVSDNIATEAIAEGKSENCLVFSDNEGCLTKR